MKKHKEFTNARSLRDTDPAMVIKPFDATITSSAVLTKLFHLIHKRTQSKIKKTTVTHEKLPK
jgi:hypothetical protein